jgi:hypothetical protein
VARAGRARARRRYEAGLGRERRLGCRGRLRRAAQEERDPGAVQQHGEQHDQARDCEQVARARHSGEHGQQHEQQRREAARAEQRDQPRSRRSMPARARTG